MLKRVSIIAGVGLATVFALPTIALGQEEQGGTEATSTESTPVTAVEQVTTEVSAALTEEPVVEEEEETDETESTSTEVEPQTAPAGDSSTASTASTANITSATQSSLTTATKSSGKKKKARASRKKCSASSRGGGAQAQASAPPAPGCVRLNTNNGAIVLPDGTTLNITETSQGEISFTVTGGNGTFSGTIFVKGGPSDPGFACVFNGVTAGTCHAPVNPNNGKFFGVSHVDACPGAFVPPGEQPDQEREGDERKKDGKVEGGRRKKNPTTVAAGETVTPQGETLPFTGLPVAWLLIVGASLISGGLAIRRKP